MSDVALEMLEKVLKNTLNSPPYLERLMRVMKDGLGEKADEIAVASFAVDLEHVKFALDEAD